MFVFNQPRAGILLLQNNSGIIYFYIHNDYIKLISHTQYFIGLADLGYKLNTDTGSSAEVGGVEGKLTTDFYHGLRG
jgi:hypothetical protein